MKSQGGNCLIFFVYYELKCCMNCKNKKNNLTGRKKYFFDFRIGRTVCYTYKETNIANKYFNDLRL